MQRAKKDGSLSVMMKEMLFSIADFRAKRKIMEMRGLMGLDRYIVNDELRLSPKLIFNSGRVHVLRDRSKGPVERAYVPSNVSTSFPSCTGMFSMSLSGKKLGVYMVANSKNKKTVRLPTREDVGRELKLTPEQIQMLPDPIIVIGTVFL